jgi:hypothetical protein
MLHRSKLWIAASLLASAPFFAQQSSVKERTQKSFEQGQELRKAQLVPGYNAPAAISLVESWDVYLIATYLYWQARQENIEIGLVSQNDPEGIHVPGGDGPFSTTYNNNISTTDPNFTYRPGCRFGIGTRLGWDGWDASAIYTWFHGGIGSGVTPLPTTGTANNIIPPKYLYAIQGETDDFFYQNADQSWSWKMDFLDLSLARSSYSGTKFVLRPLFGARAAWIRQKLKTSYMGSTTYASTLGYTKSTNQDSSVSWGIGPRAGFESNWLLGYGMRLIGNGSLDVLYTRYRLRKNDQIAFLDGRASPIAENISVSQKIDYLRAHTDLELGFGWGSYFDYDNWHIDLWATYGFQIFWNQNMFRNFQDPSSMPGKSIAPNGDLFIHGLTVNGRLDF